MKESSTLEAVRRWSLRVAIVTSVAFLVLLVLWVWGAFNLTNMDSFYKDLEQSMYSGSPNLDLPFTVWAKIMMTLSVIANTATSILLTLLIAKFAKNRKEK